MIKICQIIETRNKEEVGQGEEEEFTKRVVMILKKTGVSIKENINSLRKDIDPQEKIFSRAFLERFIEIVDALITFQGFDIFPIGLESDSLRVDEDGILFSDFGKALKTDKNKNKNDDDLVKRKNLQIRSFARLLSKFLEEHKEALNEEVFEKLDEYVNKLKKYDEKNKYHYILHERNVLTVIIVFHILMK